MRSGRNRVLVTAHTSDGRERRTEFELRYVKSLEQDRLLADERKRQSAHKLRKELEIRAEVEEVQPEGEPSAP